MTLCGGAYMRVTKRHVVVCQHWSIVRASVRRVLRLQHQWGVAGGHNNSGIVLSNVQQAILPPSIHLTYTTPSQTQHHHVCCKWISIFFYPFLNSNVKWALTSTFKFWMSNLSPTWISIAVHVHPASQAAAKGCEVWRDGKVTLLGANQLLCSYHLQCHHPQFFW